MRDCMGHEKENAGGDKMSFIGEFRGGNVNHGRKESGNTPKLRLRGILWGFLNNISKEAE